MIPPLIPDHREQEAYVVVLVLVVLVIVVLVIVVMRHWTSQLSRQYFEPEGGMSVRQVSVRKMSQTYAVRGRLSTFRRVFHV